MHGPHNAEVTPTYNDASGNIHRGFELRSLPQSRGFDDGETGSTTGSRLITTFARSTDERLYDVSSPFTSEM